MGFDSVCEWNTSVSEVIPESYSRVLH